MQVHDHLPIDDTTSLGYCRSQLLKKCDRYQNSSFDECVSNFAIKTVEANYNCSLFVKSETICQINAQSKSHNSTILDEYHGKLTAECDVMGILLTQPVF